MNSLKITDFFKIDLQNFYSINDKDMTLGNLDSCHHTQSNNSLKNKNSLANKFQCTSSLTRMHLLKITDFF